MILLYTFLILNIIAFLLMGYDKKLAQNHKRRISETILLTFVFLGGSIGSGLGMHIFRHKMSKKSYLFKFWLSVIVQILFGFIYTIKSK